MIDHQLKKQKMDSVSKQVPDQIEGQMAGQMKNKIPGQTKNNIPEQIKNQMTKKERVWAAIRHEESDRVPKGELYIQPQIANKLLGEEYPLDYQHFERDCKVRELLHMDLVNVGDWPEWEIEKMEDGKKVLQSVYGQTFLEGEESKRLLKPPVDIEDAADYQEPDINKVTGNLVARYAAETDFFVFAQVGGPISMLNEMYPMEDYMVNCITYPEETHILSEKVIAFEIKKAKLFLDKGADAILIADDMAFNTGVFLPPYVMEENVYPFYKQMIQEIKAYKNVPVFLHSDGNLNSVMDDLVECGFDGIQSIQPSAGMDIRSIKEKYGDRLCLWGNIDLDYIMCFGTEEEVRADVRKTIEAAGTGGGFILSTCNTMVDIIPPENILAMIREADK